MPAERWCLGWAAGVYSTYFVQGLLGGSAGHDEWSCAVTYFDSTNCDVGTLLAAVFSSRLSVGSFYLYADKRFDTGVCRRATWGGE